MSTLPIEVVVIKSSGLTVPAESIEAALSGTEEVAMLLTTKGPHSFLFARILSKI